MEHAQVVSPNVQDSVQVPITDTMTYPLSYVMGHFDPSTHPDFVEIPIRYADRGGLFLRKDVSFWELNTLKLIIKMEDTITLGSIIS